MKKRPSGCTALWIAWILVALYALLFHYRPPMILQMVDDMTGLSETEDPQ